MRQTLAAILAVSVLGVGCASLQETRMYKGPFGRTEVGGVLVAADPVASKILVATYDGDLWIYDVDSDVGARLSSLRVGDEVILAFDDRIAGQRAVDLGVVASGTRILAPGELSAVQMLPAGVVFGAPAINPSGMVAVAGPGMGTMAAGVAPGTGVVTGSNGTFVTGGTTVAGGTAFTPAGTVFTPGATVFTPNGTVMGANGTFVLGPGGVPVFTGPGVIMPGFGSFSALPAGVVTPQTAATLGLVPGGFITTPMGGPSVATTGGMAPGNTPITSGNFTPGTIAPGVTTANPNAFGAPVVMGPFTPGTVAPGVSAPPPAAGATTTGGRSGTPTFTLRGTPSRDTTATGSAATSAPAGSARVSPTAAAPRTTMTRSVPASQSAPPQGGAPRVARPGSAQGGTMAAPASSGAVMPQGTTVRPQGGTTAQPAPQPAGQPAQPAGGTAARPPGDSQ